MQKPPSDELSLLQFQSPQNIDNSQELTPQQQLQKSRKQYFNVKLTLSVIIVIMATISVQSQMQSFAPFVRNVQNFFNYHLLTHESQDIYEGGDVIYYRTQEYIMAEDIMGFFQNYEQTMHKYHKDSFFYPFKDLERKSNEKSEIVKILIITEVDEKNQITQKLNENGYNLIKQQGGTLQTKIRNRIILRVHEQQWILERPLDQIGEFFDQTVLNKDFYKRKVKRIQLQTKLPIEFKTKKNCSVQVKTTCVFHSGMMMAVKVETNVIDQQKEQMLQKSNHDQNPYNQQNLGIRKLSDYHNMKFLFQNIGYFIFAVNCLLFCVELMVIIRTNFKIEQTLNEEKQFQKYIQYFTFINKKKNSPQAHPHHLTEQHQHQKHQNPNIIQDEQLKTDHSKKITYLQRLDMIGLYNVIELTLSFLVLITVNHKGLVCLWCWTKMSIYLSETGNRMMIGFLFKKAIPFYLKIIFNLSIWLSGFVFFSMVTYRISKKFQTVQLSYYQYLFNYFQYGIFENFRPIQRYGWPYSFLYFIQMSFLVMIGNNILMSILAQQVLKNSNMEALIEFIQQIQVECPVCGSPPQVKKKIKLKPGNQRDQQFISQYFQSKKESQAKSKYEIKILSPQLSPMFHKSQLKQKSFKLRKFSNNNVSIIGEQSFLDSPPISPLYSPSPRSPISSPFGSRRPQEQKKKVKIEIGGQIKEKKVSKIEQFSKTIKTKSQVINKIIQELSHSPVLSHNPANKSLVLQFMKKKVQQIKHITSKME